MNAPARFDREGEDEVYCLDSPAPDVAGRHRQDGWTPARQHQFLTALAEGHTVEQCCRFVGLTVSSAYALRRRASGAAFALGWQAATLLARDTFADTLCARAIDGQVETITRADGAEVTRHRYDNRLATAMLTRLDRLAAEGDERTHQAARLIASDWEAYLAGIERGGGPARAGLFLGARVGAAAATDAAPDLEPLAALARADRFMRTRAAMPEDLDVRDLDPACRGAWSGADWARAEAAGLVVLAAPPLAEPCADAADAQADERVHGTSPLPPLPPRLADGMEPVWWDPDRAAWMTCFPLPEGADRPEHACGDPDDATGAPYERSLTPGELAALEAARAALLDDPMPDPHADREAWFAGLRAAAAAAESDAPLSQAPTPAEAGAQLGDAAGGADCSITAANPSGPPPSRGWVSLAAHDDAMREEPATDEPERHPALRVRTP